MVRVVIVEVIRPSVGGYDVLIHHSYKEEASSPAWAKHFKHSEEVLEYISKTLERELKAWEVERDGR